MFRLPSFSPSNVFALLIVALAFVAGLRVDPACAQYNGYSKPGADNYSPRAQRRAPLPDDYDYDAPRASRAYGDEIYDPDKDPELMPPGTLRKHNATQRRYPENHWYYGRRSERRETGEEDQDVARGETTPGNNPNATLDATRNANLAKPSLKIDAWRSLAGNPPPVPEKRGGREGLSVASKAPLTGVLPETLPPSDPPLTPAPIAVVNNEAVTIPPAVAAVLTDKAAADGANGDEKLTLEQKPNVAAKSGLTVVGLDDREKVRAPFSKADASVSETPLPIAARPPVDVLTKMIGQMLFVGFQGFEPADAGPERLSAQIASGYVGGVVFMAHNIRSPDQAKRLTGGFRAQRTEHPLLIAIDQEGGDVQRLAATKGFQQHASAAELGAANDPLKANEVYARLAAELRQTGFNLNFGPVVDLNRNAASAIIAGKKRSYGSDPRHVLAFAKAFAVAHRDAGILTALKHFPGHGATAGDTHDGPVNIAGVWSEDELEPYRALADNKYADIVMVGHLSHPKFSGPNAAPASLSREAVQIMLRGSLGYEGVTITDDLEMNAVSTRYTTEETLLLAIEAGNDLLLITNKKAYDPDLPERAIQSIRKAVDTGRISRERIRTSYERILQLKRSLSRMQQKNAQAQNSAAKTTN